MHMLAAPEGTQLHGVGSLSWRSWACVTLRAQLCTAASGGFRKAELEMIAGAAFKKTHMSRTSLFWVIRGVVVSRPAAAQLLGSVGRGPLQERPMGPRVHGPPAFLSLRAGYLREHDGGPEGHAPCLPNAR